MSRVFHLTPEKPRSRRSFAGRKANAIGRHFQEAIKSSAAYQKDVVALEELPSQGAKRVWNKGQQLLIPLRIPCDFVGAFVGGRGRGLYFDAKSCGADDVSFHVKTMVKEHQWDFLLKMARAGQVAGFLVECKARERYLWIDAEDVPSLSEPIRFARDGVFCEEWVDLGSTLKLVDFSLLKKAYTP